MKVLTELAISLDRISTREELEEVWHLLTDPYAPEDNDISTDHLLAEPRLVDWRAELQRVGNEIDTGRDTASDLVDDEDEEQLTQSREQNLMELLLQMNAPTN
jgi:hypothetical protein